MRHAFLGQNRGLHFRLAHLDQAFGERQLANSEVGRTTHEGVVRGQADHDARRPRPDLREQRCAPGVVCAHAIDDLAPVFGPLRDLEQREGEWSPAHLRDLRHEVDLGHQVVRFRHASRLTAAQRARRDHLEHATFGGPHGRRYREHLVVLGKGARHGLSAHRDVPENPRSRETDGTGVEGLGDDALHLPQIRFVCRLVGTTAIAHDVVAHGAVGDERTDVERVLPARQEVEVLGIALPCAPGHAFVERRAGYVLDALHELDQILLAARRNGGEADAAVAHHDRGDAMARGGVHVRIPGHLAVIVRVHVDPAGRNDAALCIDDLSRIARERLADRDDDPILQGNVAGHGVRARTIHEQAISDQRVEHCLGSSCRRPVIAQQDAARQSAGSHRDRRARLSPVHTEGNPRCCCS